MLGLTIDPGVSTGMCLFSWTDTTPMKVEWVRQFRGGAPMFAAYLSALGIRVEADMLIGDDVLDALVVEKFTPRSPRAGAEFALTRESAEPLVGEGVLIGRGFLPMIQWAEPSMQYFMGGENLADRKKRARAFLKKHGMLVTGKDVGEPDADDAISATLHSVAWMRRQRHRPTIEALFGEERA
jgi:hypothetical protein